MALNPATFDQLVRNGYGPLQFVRRDDGVDTVWNGHEILVRPDASTLCVATERSVMWPGAPGIEADEVERRVQRALAEIVVERGGLLRVDGVAARSVVTVAVWLDDGAGPADLAEAVRAVDMIGTVAEWAIELVDARLDVEAQMVELSREVESDLEAARGAMSASPTGGDAAAISAAVEGSAVEPAPSPAAGPPPGPAAPAAAVAPPWCYVLSPLDVLDPADTNRVLTYLHPGEWYVLLDRQGAWSRVTDQDRTFEGWAASDQVYRRDG